MPVVQAEVVESRKRRRGSGNNNHFDPPPQWRLTMNYCPAVEAESSNEHDADNHQSSLEEKGNGTTTIRRCRPGFPWHRDLKANGACSIILGLGSSGRLEFGKEPGFDSSQPPPKDNRVENPDEISPVRLVELRPGSLLILTGPARWHFVHRVLNGTHGSGGEERASLVWGIW
mmetsp:Transcript_14570/g.27718  ORF Transcript_14570/g.27718 Transcript_14570/m.27718 type:complete len:173 (-) Transcript_14570:155-673(-)